MNDWLDAEQRVERAQELSESQRWEEAVGELDVALSINPGNAAWHAQRGILLEELNRSDEAMEAFEHALALEPGDRDVAVALGQGLARLGRYARSLEVFEELVRTHPDFEPAYCHRIHVYTELGQHDQAEEMFYLAQELDDACPSCFFHIGASLAARGRTQRAIYCYRRVLELEPNYVGVNRRIAQAYRAQGRRGQAREYFLRELRDDPGNTDLLYELAELMLEGGQVATAAAKLGQIIELEPENARARLALGRIWLNRGRAKQALECFETVESLVGNASDLPDYDRLVGTALYRLGRFDKAHERFLAVVERVPQDREALTLLGDCLLLMGKPAEAADWFRRVIAVDAHDPRCHHRLSLCLLRTGRYEAALEHCLDALRDKPGFGPAMHHAAIAYLRLGAWRDARSMLRRALHNDPTNPVLQRLSRRMWRYRFRHVLRKLGRLLRLFPG